MNTYGVSLAYEFLKLGDNKIDQVDISVRKLLIQMNENSKNLKLTREVELIFDKAIEDNIIDFTTSAEFSEAIDTAHKLGVLKGDKKYTFTEKELRMLKKELDNYEKDMEMKNQQSLLLTQPMLQLIKQLVDIMFESMKDENKLITDIQQR
ncbi:MAG: hypothetical protein A3F40_02115 [Chlamydiae bacterium RIFCSPHIGHO2_12_FULL_27_8]|nr:MAG: hypothetical protein A3F40_02115 [Chlamydiae bacterium RIFCSPHIGHO2_12_FULL_27_8]